MVKKVIQQLDPYVPEKSLDELKEELGLSSLVRLSANENVFGPSPKVEEALKREGFSNLNLYPDSNLTELRDAVSRQFKISGKNLVFGNGLDEIIELISRVVLEPGDEVIQPWPTFSEYQLHAQIESAKIVNVPVEEDGAFDISKLLGAVNAKTRLIWFCNPNNPTGELVSRAEIAKFVESVPSETYVIVDEAYIDFTGDPKDSVIDLVAKYPNLIVMRTFSKAYGLANLRIGFGVFPAQLVGYLQAVRLPYAVNSVTELAATVAVEDQSYVQKIVATVISERSKWQKFLKANGFEFYPSYANFVFFKAENSDDLHEFLMKNGYLLRAGLRKGWLRVSIGKPQDNQRVRELITKFYAK